MISVYKDVIAETHQVNLNELGLTFLDFNPLSLESDIDIESSEGVDGGAIVNNQFKERQIQAKLYLKAKDNNDFQNKKSNVYKLFNGKQELLMVDNRLTNKKVWKVVTNGSYNLENDQTPYTKAFELLLVSESSYATALKETETLINSSEGYLFNGGDVYLDTREHKIKIIFLGNSDKLRIVNETTNTQWQYFGTTTIKDELKIESIYPFKNNESIFEETNFGALEFAQGSNKIKIYGASGNFNLIATHHDLFV